MSKDLIGVFKPEAKTVGQIFINKDGYYQIPDYQRPYRWDDEQIEQLWDDIYSAMESGHESYFLGPMILIGSKDNGYFEVVDGQQRLTTLMILFCVLRDLYLKDNKEIQSAIKSWETDQYRLRLKFQPYYQNQFEQEILAGINFPDREFTKKEREKNKYINTALIFKSEIEKIEEKELLKLVDYLFNKVVMITIICSNRDFAINLFQVINTRGLDLEAADLIKSHLLEKCKENKKKQFIATWDVIVTDADQIEESLTDLFTYYEYYLLAQNPEKSLYEELSNKFKNGDSNKIIYEFKKFVESFVEIYQMESKLIFSFWYLPNQVFWKAILTTAKYEGFDNFNGLCKELRRMYYSYWIAGHTTSKIKQLSFNIISWIKGKKKLNEIKDKISQTMKDHKVSDKVKESLSDDTYGEKWLRPVLALIEYEQTDDSKIFFIELNKKLHADHVLPEKWNQKNEWKKYWDEEQANNWLDKIGNLTLLSGKKNIAQHNDPPQKKAKMYKIGHGGKTAFEISKNIIKELEKGKWTEDTVKKRQSWLIKQIETILGIG